jgi:hypothetical protein
MGQTELGPAEGGGFVAAVTKKVALLELARGLPTGFRLRAEMRQGDARAGYVGVYVGRSQFDTPPGRWHCLLCVLFADRGNFARAPGKGSFLTRVQACRGPDGIPSVNPIPAKQEALPVPPGGWRVLEVDVTSPVVRVRIDGVASLEMSRADLASSSRNIAEYSQFGELKAVTPTFAPNDGVGVISLASPVAVRRITLGRLD